MENMHNLFVLQGKLQHNIQI